MDCYPDSALKLLQHLNNSELDEETRALHALMTTKAAHKSYCPPKDNSLIKKAATFFSGSGDSLETQSLYYLGVFHSQNYSLDTALILLNDSYSKAQSNEDNFYAAMSAREIASIYTRLLTPSLQLKWAEIAKEGFIAAHRTTHADWMDIDILNALINGGRYDEAEAFCHKADSTIKDKSKGFQQEFSLAEIELLSSQNKHSEVIEKYHTLANEGYHFTAHDLCRMADSELTLGNTTNIISILNEISQLPLNREDTLYVNHIKQKYLAAKGDYKGAYEAALQFSSSVMRYEGEILVNPQTNLLTENLKLRMEHEKSENETRRWLNIVMAIMSGVLTLLIFFIAKYLNTRLVNKTLEADKNLKDILLLKEELEQSEVRLNESVLMTEKISALDEKHKFQATSIYNLFSRHLDVLDEVCRAYFIRNENENIDISFHKRVSNALNQIRHIDMLNELEEFINRGDDDWMSRFIEAYPQLKGSQYLLVMYIYIGLSSEAIAVLLGKKSLQAVYMAKTKLKKKLLEVNGGRIDEFMDRLKMQ